MSSLVVMGDLNVELTSRLTERTFGSIKADLLDYACIDVRVGGVAYNLALASRKYFSEVALLSRVGNDALGGLITSALHANCIDVLLSPHPTQSTGAAIYVRDRSPQSEQGVRLLLIDKGANSEIDIDAVRGHASALADADAFFIDGYSFLESPRREAGMEAISLARRAGTPVAFDLVPHDTLRYFRPAFVAELIQLADLTIAEVRSIQPMLGVTPSESRDAKAASETLEVLTRRFPDKGFELRYGLGNVDDSLLLLPGTDSRRLDNQYRTCDDPRGFGDLLTAATLAKLIDGRHGP